MVLAALILSFVYPQSEFRRPFRIMSVLYLLVSGSALFFNIKLVESLILHFPQDSAAAAGGVLAMIISIIFLIGAALFTLIYLPFLVIYIVRNLKMGFGPNTPPRQ